MKDGERSFTVLELMKPAQLTKKRHSMKKTGLTNNDGGRFESKDPAGAAKKAFNQGMAQNSGICPSLASGRRWWWVSKIV